jgi:cellobiose-specific phosphotransferase system component IIC
MVRASMTFMTKIAQQITTHISALSNARMEAMPLYLLVHSIYSLIPNTRVILPA